MGIHMKRTIIAALLLMSFGMAEEASNHTTGKSSQKSTQEIKQETPKNLQDLGRGYAKDPTTNQIYYEGKLIKNAHSESFKVYKDDSERPYQLLGEEIYDAEDRGDYFIKGVRQRLFAMAWVGSKNISTFGPLYNTKQHIPSKCVQFLESQSELLKCFQTEVFPEKSSNFYNINPEEFEPIGIGITPDKYFKETFRYNPHIFWKDKHRVYMTSHLSSFKDMVEIERDNRFDYEREDIQPADPETFELLFYPYAKDKNKLYVYDNDCNYDRKLWQHIDPKSLVYLGGSADYKSKHFSDYKGKVEETIDYYKIHYIKVTDKIHYKNNDIKTTYSIYYQSKYSVDLTKVKGADAETFEILSYPYAKDQNFVYYNGEIIPNFSSQGFVIDGNNPFDIAHNDIGVVFYKQPLEGLTSSNLEVTINDTSYEGDGRYDRSHRQGLGLLKNSSIAYYLSTSVATAIAVLLPLDTDSIEFINIGMDSFKDVIKDKDGVYYLYETRYEESYYDKSNPTALFFKDRIGIKRLALDSQTVEYVDEENIKDKNGIYSLGNLKESGEIIYKPDSIKQYILYISPSNEWDCIRR